MLKSIKGKLLAGFLGVIAVVAISGTISLVQIKDISQLTNHFVEDLWSAADLIMETNITLQEDVRTVLDPADELDRRAFADGFHKRLAEIRTEFEATELPEEAIAHIFRDLEDLDSSFETPLYMAGKPGEAMEVADAAMGPILEILEEQNHAVLNSMLWQSCMLFNDILITGDLALETEYGVASRKIKNHPDFGIIAKQFAAYDKGALGVFSLFREEHKARESYIGTLECFLGDLERLESDFEANAVDPAVAELKEKLASVNVAQMVSMGLSLILSLCIAFFMANLLARPLVKTAAVIREMAMGHLEDRVSLDQQDEVGSMARALDSFADSLQNEVVASLEKAAAGDLDFDIEPRDENDKVRGAIRTLSRDLNEMVAGIRGAGDQIAAGSKQVADAAQTLSQGSTESAASLQEIGASMTELADQTRINAENAGEANTISSEAQSAAETGNEQMSRMVEAMAEIDKSSKDISNIIKVIDDIAFQTNLLALNAAVEAARAGKHGKGFAVVAEEVRNLAGRSAKAARETAQLIESSTAITTNGGQTAHQAADALGSIVEKITRVSALVEEITLASRNQANGFDEVNNGLSQIDQVTQSNTATAEESAAAAEELSSQSAEMRDLLARFKLKKDSAAGSFGADDPNSPQMSHADYGVREEMLV